MNAGSKVPSNTLSGQYTGVRTGSGTPLGVLVDRMKRNRVTATAAMAPTASANTALG